MGRAPCCDKNGLKKGPWTPEEDQKLIDYIQKHGYGNWRTLPKNAGLQRCGKSCRLRWTNYLRPDIKRGRFSFEEEEAIIQFHSILGNKWSAIAARLPGRTDNEIKNYWNTHIRKRLLRMGIDPVTHSPRLDLLDFSSILNTSLYNSSSQMNMSRLLGLQPLVNPELLRLATTLLSTHQRQNPSFFGQNLQENQLCSNAQIQNSLTQVLQNSQIQTPIQNINPPCTTVTSTPCVPFPPSDEAQVVEPSFANYPSTLANFDAQNFGDQSCSHLNEWQSNDALNSYFIQDLVSQPSEKPSYYYATSNDQNSIMDPSSDNSNLQSANTSNQNFSFPATTTTSVLSTPASSPTPLNSNSTYFNNGSTTTTTEDERESYCSNMIKFEIPDFLDVSQFL
ncbi:hypothetical protein Ancab_005098 [Ancistrocladus abbreviatus]